MNCVGCKGDNVADVLSGKHLILGISGGIAAYKSAELVRRLQDHGVTVQVVMTEAATHFVTPVTFQALSQRPVFTDQWDGRIANNMAHIELSRVADAILIAPASADMMAKLAHGAADDLLSILCLARECPLLVAPAMNRQMWAHPATQRNAQTLHNDGVVVLGPNAGSQACGEIGDGRMLEVSEMIEALSAFFTKKSMAGKRVVMTAGPTFEAIDPVRGLTNRSSGKMGYALANAMARAGASVFLVSGPTALPSPAGVTRVSVESARQMRDAVMQEAPGADCFIAVAAVADWGIANSSQQKIKKQSGAAAPGIELVENPDILAQVARLPEPPYCVGFAAESEHLEQFAADKRVRKGIPLLIANLVQEAVQRDDAELLVIDAHGSKRLARASKDEQAILLVAEIAQRLAVT
jgi:phosphopantothenoylcysteine decarboxylase/phosphopantothenate--cysteine ligase